MKFRAQIEVCGHPRATGGGRYHSILFKSQGGSLIYRTPNALRCIETRNCVLKVVVEPPNNHFNFFEGTEFLNSYSESFPLFLMLLEFFLEI